MHINDLFLRSNSVSEPILLVDDMASVITSGRNFKDFSSLSNLVLSHLIKCFAANYLVLNLDKMNTMKFVTKNSAHSTLHIGYKEKYIEETVNTKFLGLPIGNHINSKNHTEGMTPMFSAACYNIRSMVHTSKINTVKSIYYAYLLSIIKY